MTDVTPKIRVEATKVGFEMASGRKIMFPPGYGQVHDPYGKVLPQCVIFFGPWKKSSTEVPLSRWKRTSRSHRDYFGTDHGKLASFGRGRLGDGVPPLPTSGWRVVGKVYQIFYLRHGKRAPGGFFHVYKTRQPTLSKAGRFYKLSLGEDCLVDDRGYRFP
jgi:hypothetical protein